MPSVPRRCSRAAGFLAKPENLRSLISRAGAAVADGCQDLSVDQLAGWRQWADHEVDKLDLIFSGQVRTHLPPRDDVG